MKNIVDEMRWTGEHNLGRLGILSTEDPELWAEERPDEGRLADVMDRQLEGFTEIEGRGLGGNEEMLRE